MIPHAFKRREVAPSDILNAARTMPRVGFHLWNLGYSSEFREQDDMDVETL